MFKCIKDINKNNINECNIMNNTESSISLLIKMTIKATFRVILRSGKNTTDVYIVYCTYNK